MIDIKQYLKETNSVLLSEQAYKYLLEKASVIEKLEAIKTEMDIIAELEEIKAEAEELIEHCDSDYDFEEIYGIRLVVGILDNRISELKGDKQ